MLSPTIIQESPVNIKKLLDDIKFKPLNIAPSASALANIEKIKKICDEEYSNKSALGASSLNRKILLDKRIADLLTPETIVTIFSLRSNMKDKIDPLSPIVIRRDKEYSTIADAIYYGFSDGTEVIQLMPNNKADDPNVDNVKDYQAQKNNYEMHTKRIVNNIKDAASLLSISQVNTAYVNPPTETPSLLKRYDIIVDAIEKLRDENKSNELLKVEGYTTDQIRGQVSPGFRRLCEVIGAKFTSSVSDDYVRITTIQKPSTLEEFSKAFINSDTALLDSLIVHQFYDAKHFQAAIEQNSIIVIGGKNYHFKDLLREMIKQCELSKGSLAYDQFKIRLHLVVNDLRNRFPEYVKATHDQEHAAAYFPPKISDQQLSQTVEELTKLTGLPWFTADDEILLCLRVPGADSYEAMIAFREQLKKFEVNLLPNIDATSRCLVQEGLCEITAVINHPSEILAIKNSLDQNKIKQQHIHSPIKQEEPQKVLHKAGNDELTVRKKFKNNESSKITQSLMVGLIQLYNLKSSKISKDDIESFEQEVNNKGQLTGILVQIKAEKAAWFTRVIGSSMSSDILTFPDREKKSGDHITIVLNPDAVKKLPYEQLLKNFSNGVHDKVNHLQLESLQEIINKVDNIAGRLSYILEQRLQHYDPATKKSSGDLQTVMLKLYISPHSSIKDMRDLNDSFIPKLRDALGADFDRVVKDYGQAVDGNAYIHFRADELENGLKSTPGLQM